jgi:hypothetical protein
MAAAAVIGFVIEAMRNMASRATGGPPTPIAPIVNAMVVFSS